MTSSDYHGVSFSWKNRKWCAYVRENTKLVHLGFFEREDDAARTYDVHASRLGLPLNFPTKKPKLTKKRTAPQVVVRPASPALIVVDQTAVDLEPPPLSPSFSPAPAVERARKVPATSCAPARTTSVVAHIAPVKTSVFTEKTSACAGVSWHNETDKWISCVSIKGRPHLLGSLNDELEAAQVFKARAAANVTSIPTEASSRGVLRRAVSALPKPGHGLMSFAALSSERKKKLHRVVGRQGTHRQLEPIHDPAALVRSTQSSTGSKHRWVDCNDVVLLSDRAAAEAFPAYFQRAASRESESGDVVASSQRPKMHRPDAIEVRVSRCAADLRARLSSGDRIELSAAVPGLGSFAPLSSREQMLVQEAFVAGLRAGSRNPSLRRRFFRESKDIKQRNLSSVGRREKLALPMVGRGKPPPGWCARRLLAIQIGRSSRGYAAALQPETNGDDDDLAPHLEAGACHDNCESSDLLLPPPLLRLVTDDDFLELNSSRPNDTRPVDFAAMGLLSPSANFSTSKKRRRGGGGGDEEEEEEDEEEEVKNEEDNDGYDDDACEWGSASDFHLDAIAENSNSSFSESSEHEWGLETDERILGSQHE